MKLLEDGRFFHSFRQSWVNTYLTCPEQARRVLINNYPVDETEAAAKGTAVHAAIESVLTKCTSYLDAVDVAVAKFREIASMDEFRWVKVKTEQTAQRHMIGGFSSWYRYVYPYLRATKWCEHSFRFVLCEDDQRVIEISGTADYADADGLMDWKLSGNVDKYGRDAWKLRRWAVQPTFYAAAAFEAGLYTLEGEVPFTFIALDLKGSQPQRAPANRTYQHVNWLKSQLVGIARQMEQLGTKSEWTLNDQHPLCSAEWCRIYDQCKGLHFVQIPSDEDGALVHLPLVSTAASAA